MNESDTHQLYEPDLGVEIVQKALVLGYVCQREGSSMIYDTGIGPKVKLALKNEPIDLLTA